MVHLGVLGKGEVGQELLGKSRRPAGLLDSRAAAGHRVEDAEPARTPLTVPIQLRDAALDGCDGAKQPRVLQADPPGGITPDRPARQENAPGVD